MTWPIFLSHLWQGRARILGGAAAGFLLALILLLVLPARYSITMVVGPVSASGPAAMGTPAARLDEWRRSNVPLPATESVSDFERYLQLLASPAAAEQLIKRVPGLLPMLFPDRWDAQRKVWRLPMSAWPAEIFARARGGAPWSAPTADEVAAKLGARLQIHRVGETQMRRLILSDGDRGFGLTLLFALHQAADNVLREEAARRSAAIADYVEKQLQNLRLAEHRLMLSELLAAQERIRLMVAVDLPYAADVVEPPSAPRQADQPLPLPLLVFGTLLGAAAAAATLLYARRSDPHAE